MKDLFAVSLNNNGFFVYPVNNPPDPNLPPTGNEVSFQVSCHLCGSLNLSVNNYFEQVTRDNPHDILLVLSQHHGWKSLLAFIRDLLWQEAWEKREESYSVFRRRNSQEIGRLVRDWL